MLLDDAQSELLKNWIIKRLEDVSDADSDVLADYVLALVKTDEPEAVAQQSCVSNLQDFLGDGATAFVNDLFAAITAKSYDPSYKPPPLLATSNGSQHSSLQPHNKSRKRALHDTERDESQFGRLIAFDSSDRPVKQARRGGRERGRGGGSRGGVFDGFASRNQQMQSQSQTPGMLPFDFSSLDPNDPVAGLLAMQRAMADIMPGFPGFAMPGLPSNTMNGTGARRCRDYDMKGFCARGASCQYEHGNDPFVVPGGTAPYDPTQAGLMHPQPIRTGIVSTSPNTRGRGEQRNRGGNANFRGGGRRAEFSHNGPNSDRSVTTVVVEQIPEQKFDEQSVRDFFDDFGPIEEVTMQAYKRLAIVKYADYDSAKAAYDSPKVVFDNRFVKVYWYKPDGLPKPPNGQAAPRRKESEGAVEPQIDPEELARKQEEAQRRHDEQKRQRDDARRQKEELEVRMKAIEAERKKMNAMLAKKEGKDTPMEEPAKEDNEQTKGLKETLAKLEAEAKALGIDPIAAQTPNGWGHGAYIPRGRGGFRGRARGRGFHPGFRGGRGGGAVMRLDNRPKTVSVEFKEGLPFSEGEEALRSWILFNSPETSTSISKNPEKSDAALVSFEQRYQGESFMAAAAAADFPLAGKIELSWYKTPEVLPDSRNVDFQMGNGTDNVAEEKMEADPDNAAAMNGDANQEHATTEARYDVDDRDDEDRWG
ncbi:unnamed protein product [Zymoseptoria tritici ST99CH_3D1]|nr:unnamed protein product [Zymoseptoria tritici ST99CH_3D1]